jgi:membrane protease YdiL (CAAX protease family)
MRRLFLAFALLSIFLFTTTLSCTNIKQFSETSFCFALLPWYVVVGSGSIHLGLISVALFFLWDKDLWTTLKGIGFPGDIVKSVIFTIIGLISIVALLLILGIAAIYLGFNDQQKIMDKISGLPWYILVFAVLMAPISEELFFRAFLVPRFGVIAPAALFGLSHLAYGSVVEVVGVLAVGLILGYIYKATKSITPCLAAHMIYNLFSISVMLLAPSLGQ